VTKNVFDKYLDGLDKLHSGDTKGASKEVAQILGGQGAKPTRILKDNIALFYKRGSRVNQALTDSLFSAEASRRKKK
jgi:hypothetical protein